MEALKDYTIMDIHHMSLNVQKEHEELKSEINDLLDVMKTIEDEINKKVEQLNEKEEEYLILIEAIKLKKEEEGK